MASASDFTHRLEEKEEVRLSNMHEFVFVRPGTGKPDAQETSGGYMQGMRDVQGMRGGQGKRGRQGMMGAQGMRDMQG